MIEDFKMIFEAIQMYGSQISGFIYVSALPNDVFKKYGLEINEDYYPREDRYVVKINCFTIGKTFFTCVPRVQYSCTCTNKQRIVNIRSTSILRKHNKGWCPAVHVYRVQRTVQLQLITKNNIVYFGYSLQMYSSLCFWDSS